MDYKTFRLNLEKKDSNFFADRMNTRDVYYRMHLEGIMLQITMVHSQIEYLKDEEGKIKLQVDKMGLVDGGKYLDDLHGIILNVRNTLAELRREEELVLKNIQDIKYNRAYAKLNIERIEKLIDDETSL